MNVVTQLFQKIDSVSINAIQTIYSALVTALLPVFSVGVTIYVVYWGPPRRSSAASSPTS